MSEEAIVSAIEEYFKRHPKLNWRFGRMKLDSKSTIELLRKDKNFRDQLVKAVIQYSLEQLINGD